jgi:hypothetical protein
MISKLRSDFHLEWIPSITYTKSAGEDSGKKENFNTEGGNVN